MNTSSRTMRRQGRGWECKAGDESARGGNESSRGGDVSVGEGMRVQGRGSDCRRWECRWGDVSAGRGQECRGGDESAREGRRVQGRCSSWQGHTTNISRSTHTHKNTYKYIHTRVHTYKHTHTTGKKDTAVTPVTHRERRGGEIHHPHHTQTDKNPGHYCRQLDHKWIDVLGVLRLGFRVRVKGLGFRVSVRVQDLGFRVRV